MMVSLSRMPEVCYSGSGVLVLGSVRDPCWGSSLLQEGRSDTGRKISTTSSEATAGAFSVRHVDYADLPIDSLIQYVMLMKQEMSSRFCFRVLFSEHRVVNLHSARHRVELFFDQTSTRDS